jgi:WD40 repeat protein
MVGGRSNVKELLMEQLHLMKSTTALVILMGAGCPFGLAQSKDSASKDSVQLIARLGGPGRVEAFAFSPDGKILAASYPRHAVIFWDVAKGEQHATLDEHHCSGPLVFTPDGKNLAMRSGIWDVRNLKKLILLGDESEDAGDELESDLLWLTFSRDGKIARPKGW